MVKENKQYFSISAYEELLEGRPSIKTCVEGILFISQAPVTINEISKVLGYNKNEISETIDLLKTEYEKDNRGFLIRKIGNGYRMYSNPSLKEILKNFVSTSQKIHITQAALETLAIIAYRQPVTRQQIAEIRGVKTDSIVISLLNKGLVREAGKLKAVGRPILYRTTSKFLELLGLKTIEELPVLTIKEE